MYIKVKKRWQLVFDFLMILIGTIIMGFAFSIFLEPNDISTGGMWLVKAFLIVLALPLGLVFARILTDNNFRKSS